MPSTCIKLVLFTAVLFQGCVTVQHYPHKWSALTPFAPEMCPNIAGAYQCPAEPSGEPSWFQSVVCLPEEADPQVFELRQPDLDTLDAVAWHNGEESGHYRWWKNAQEAEFRFELSAEGIEFGDAGFITMGDPWRLAAACLGRKSVTLRKAADGSLMVRELWGGVGVGAVSLFPFPLAGYDVNWFRFLPAAIPSPATPPPTVP